MDKLASKTIPIKDVLTHGIYVGIIIVLVFVYLVSIRVAGNKEAVDYISFAATLTSLILALLAIYLGISVSSFLAGARELNAQGQNTQAELRLTGAKNLETSERLAEQVRQLAGHVNDMQGSVTTQLTDLNTKLMQSEPNAIGLPKLVSSDEQKPDLAKIFLGLSSFNGLLIAYYVARTAGTEIEYNRSELIQSFPILGSEYALGFLVAGISVEVFVPRSDRIAEPFVFVSTRIGDVSAIVHELRMRLERMKVEMPANWMEAQQQMNQIKAYLDLRLPGRPQHAVF